MTTCLCKSALFVTELDRCLQPQLASGVGLYPGQCFVHSPFYPVCSLSVVMSLGEGYRVSVLTHSRHVSGVAPAQSSPGALFSPVFVRMFLYLISLLLFNYVSVVSLISFSSRSSFFRVLFHCISSPILANGSNFLFVFRRLNPSIFDFKLSKMKIEYKNYNS